MIKNRRQAGFTLIELLIALAIFAVLGVLIAGALKRTLTTYQILQQRQTQLEKLSLTQALLRNDIIAIQPRSVLNANNVAQSAIQPLPNGGFAITTASRDNPNGWFSRSTLQRVRYQLIGQNWVRQTWPTLDGTTDAGAETQVLLSHIVSCVTHYAGNNGQLSSSISIPTTQLIPSLPKGILVDLTFDNGKHMIGVYPINFQKDRGEI